MPLLLLGESPQTRYFRAMAYTTASILIGMPHPMGGGISATHVALLAENSRPSWTLRSVVDAQVPTTWIPSEVDRIFTDALVMIAVCVFNSTPIHNLLAGAQPGTNPGARRVELDGLDLSIETKAALDAAVLADRTDAALVINAGSHPPSMLGGNVLENLQWNVEVSFTCWERFRVPFGDDAFEVRGELRLPRA